MHIAAHHKTPLIITLLIVGSVVALTFALLSQYVFGLFPCHFCLLQRYPYLVAIACGAIALLAPPLSALRKYAVIIGVLALLVTGGLGLYHTGIERGWIDYSGGCVADASALGSIDDLRAQVMSAPRVSCADATAMFLGLSMASWNALYAFTLVALILTLPLRRRMHG